MYQIIVSLCFLLLPIFAIACEQAEVDFTFLQILNQRSNEMKAEHKHAQNLPHGKELLILIEKNDVTEDAIYDYLDGLSIDEVTELKPLEWEIRKKLPPVIDAKIKDIIALKRKACKEDLDNKKLDAMCDLFPEVNLESWYGSMDIGHSYYQ